jgi:cytochrome c peroxidase
VGFSASAARQTSRELPTDLVNLPGDLAAVAVPAPANLGDFVRDEDAARVLGKALFWDMQVGSDGIQACATCHFRAGAAPRSRNQVSPGLLVHGKPDLTYRRVGPNAQLQGEDFPLTRLAVPGQRGSLDPLTDSNDIVSSQGVHRRTGPARLCRERAEHAPR